MKRLAIALVFLLTPSIYADTVCTDVPWHMTGKIRRGSIPDGQRQYVNAEIPGCAQATEAPSWSVTFTDLQGNSTAVQFTVTSNPRVIFFDASPEDGTYRVDGTVYWSGGGSTSATTYFRKGNLP